MKRVQPWHCGEVNHGVAANPNKRAQGPEVENCFHCVWTEMIAQQIIMALFLTSGECWYVLCYHFQWHSRRIFFFGQPCILFLKIKNSSPDQGFVKPLDIIFSLNGFQSFCFFFVSQTFVPVGSSVCSKERFTEATFTKHNNCAPLSPQRHSEHLPKFLTWTFLRLNDTCMDLWLCNNAGKKVRFISGKHD